MPAGACAPTEPFAGARYKVLKYKEKKSKEKKKLLFFGNPACAPATIFLNLKCIRATIRLEISGLVRAFGNLNTYVHIVLCIIFNILVKKKKNDYI